MKYLDNGIDLVVTIILSILLVLAGLIAFSLIVCWLIVCAVVYTVLYLTNGTMLQKLFVGMFGFKIVYESNWGVFDRRYDSIDIQMQRPIHENMGIAPPWAKMKFVRKNKK